MEFVRLNDGFRSSLFIDNHEPFDSFAFIITACDCCSKFDSRYVHRFISKVNSNTSHLSVCNGPLGMTNKDIRDWQITASSSQSDPDCHERYARLYQTKDRAWCPRYKSDSEWLQIDLGVTGKVSSLIAQSLPMRMS
jgi:hypothetical protein